MKQSKEGEIWQLISPTTFGWRFPLLLLLLYSCILLALLVLWWEFEVQPSRPDSDEDVCFGSTIEAYLLFAFSSSSLRAPSSPPLLGPAVRPTLRVVSSVRPTLIIF